MQLPSVRRAIDSPLPESVFAFFATFVGLWAMSYLWPVFMVVGIVVLYLVGLVVVCAAFIFLLHLLGNWSSDLAAALWKHRRAIPWRDITYGAITFGVTLVALNLLQPHFGTIGGYAGVGFMWLIVGLFVVGFGMLAHAMYCFFGRPLLQQPAVEVIHQEVPRSDIMLKNNIIHALFALCATFFVLAIIPRSFWYWAGEMSVIGLGAVLFILAIMVIACASVFMLFFTGAAIYQTIVALRGIFSPFVATYWGRKEYQAKQRHYRALGGELWLSPRFFKNTAEYEERQAKNQRIRQYVGLEE